MNLGFWKVASGPSFSFFHQDQAKVPSQAALPVSLPRGGADAVLLDGDWIPGWGGVPSCASLGDAWWWGRGCVVPLIFEKPWSGHSSLIFPAFLSPPFALLFLEVPGKVVATHKPIPASRDVVWLTQPFISCCLCPERRGVLWRREFPGVLPTQVCDPCECAGFNACSLLTFWNALGKKA